MVTHFKEENHKSKKNSVKFETLTTISKSNDTLVIITKHRKILRYLLQELAC